MDNGYSYTVMTDGTLSVTPSTGEALRGAVSADGRFGFASGGDMTGDDVWFILLCR